MPTTADEPFLPAPCPTCRRTPDAVREEVGDLIRCDKCGTRFRVAAAPPKPAADAPPAKATRGGDGGNVYDDGYGRFAEKEVPKGAVALAIMHFLYAGLFVVCGVLSSVFLKMWPTALPGPMPARGNTLFPHVIHVLTVAAAPVLICAGVYTLRRRPAGRVLGYVGVGLAVVLSLLEVANLLLNSRNFTGAPGETADLMCGMLYQIVYWSGYVITTLVLLVNTGKKAG